VGVGLVLTPATLTWTAGSWLQARRAGRWTRRAMATAGMALVALGIMLAASALFQDIPVWVAGIAWGVAGFGMGLSYSTTSTTVLSEADASSQGAAAAALQLSDGLGQALGTGLGGAIVASAVSGAAGRRDALAVVFSFMVVVALIGIITSRRFPPDPPTIRRRGVSEASGMEAEQSG